MKITNQIEAHPFVKISQVMLCSRNLERKNSFTGDSTDVGVELTRGLSEGPVAREERAHKDGRALGEDHEAVREGEGRDQEARALLPGARSAKLICNLPGT